MTGHITIDKHFDTFVHSYTPTHYIPLQLRRHAQRVHILMIWERLLPTLVSDFSSPAWMTLTKSPRPGKNLIIPGQAEFG